LHVEITNSFKGQLTRKSSNAIFWWNLIKYVSMNILVKFFAQRAKMAKLYASKHGKSGKLWFCCFLARSLLWRHVRTCGEEHGQDQDWISCRIFAIFFDQDWIWILIFDCCDVMSEQSVKHVCVVVHCQKPAALIKF